MKTRRPCPTCSRRTAGSSRPTELAEQREPQGGGVRRGPTRTRRRSGPSRPSGCDWDQKWDRVLDWDDPPFAKWFVGGTLNAAYNCVDRHVEAGLGDRVALHWVGEPEDDTRDDHLRRAEGRGLPGRQRADRARRRDRRPGRDLHADDPRDRGRDAGLRPDRRPAHRRLRRLLRRRAGLPARRLRGEGRHHLRRRLPPRRGRRRSSRPSTRRAPRPEQGHDVEQGARRHAAPARTSSGTTAVDVWWHDAVDKASTEHEPEAFDAEHPLYVMYTSGTTGKPKGILHTTGGYLTGAAYTHWAVFDLKPETDVYWCTADIGWVTGHSYIVYGPLANGATQVIYEGTPDTPERAAGGRSSRSTSVTIFYTAPTAIRSFMKQGSEIPDKYDMSSLRMLGSVGEPINPEAYIWYRQVIGGDRTPVVDTWWQTETGAIMISPLPGVTARQARLGDDPDPRRLRRRRRRRGRVGAQRLRRLPRAHRAVAVDAAHASGATTSGSGTPTGRGSRSRAATSPATAPRRTTTATSGCSAGSTTS